MNVIRPPLLLLQKSLKLQQIPKCQNIYFRKYSTFNQQYKHFINNPHHFPVSHKNTQLNPW